MHQLEAHPLDWQALRVSVRVVTVSFTPTPWIEHVLGDIRLAVHREQPVAVLRQDGVPERVISWPLLDVGLAAVTAVVQPALTGIWVFYSPTGSDDLPLPPGRPAAVHISTGGDLATFTDLVQSFPVGATRHGLWLSHDPFTDPEDKESWGRERQLSILGADGMRSVVVLDRQPAFALEDEGGARLLVYAGPPDAERDSSGGATYTYHLGTLSVPDAVPPELLAPTDGFEDEAEEELMRLMQRSVVATSADPPAVADCSWALVELTPEIREAAVATVTGEFSDLGRYWISESGEASPLSEGLATRESRSLTSSRTRESRCPSRTLAILRVACAERFACSMARDASLPFSTHPSPSWRTLTLALCPM